MNKIIPDRVIINLDCEATTLEHAEKDFNIKPFIVFKRDDGWILGAPEQFEDIAYEVYEDSWVDFSIDMKTWLPIDLYNNF
jgi:hypothetical protein